MSTNNNVTSAINKPYLSSEGSAAENVKQKTSTNMNKDFDINGLILLMQELFQKLRNTLQDQTVKQSVNSFNIIKSSVEKKQQAANKNQMAGIISSVVGGAGGLLSIGATFGAAKIPGIAKKKPDGMMNDKQLANIQPKVNDFTKASLKTKNEQLSKLDTEWANNYKLLADDKKINLKPGILDIKDGKLKDSEKVSGLRDQLKTFHEKSQASGDYDSKILDSWKKKKNTALGDIESSLNKLNSHGVINDKQLGKIKPKIDDFSAAGLKPKNEQLSKLDTEWENTYKLLADDKKINLKSGILDIKDGKLKDSEKVSGLRDQLKTFHEKSQASGDYDSKILDSWTKQKNKGLGSIESSLNKLNPHSYQSSSEAIKMAGVQVGPNIANSVGQLGSTIITKEATAETISAEYLKENHSVYSRQQEVDSNNMRAYSQKLTDVTRSLVDIYGAMVNATNWK